MPRNKIIYISPQITCLSATFFFWLQAQERERIRRDELDYLHQRHATAELQRALDKRRNEEEAWYRQQELLTEAEQQRKGLIMEEEQKLVDQRVR